MDFLYGKLCQYIEEKEYDGQITDTAKVTVDNHTNSIRVDVFTEDSLSPTSTLPVQTKTVYTALQEHIANSPSSGGVNLSIQTKEPIDAEDGDLWLNPAKSNESLVTVEQMHNYVSETADNLKNDIDIVKNSVVRSLNQIADLKTEFYYYNSLSSALADITNNCFDNSIEAADATIKISVDNFVTISLLANIELNESVIFTKNTILNLKGFTISTSSVIGILNNSELIIYADDGKVVSYTNTSIPSVFTVTGGSKLIINGGSYERIAGTADTARIFNNTGYLEINDANLSIVNSAGSCVGIYVLADGKTVINNSIISADATKDGTKTSANGILNYGELYINKSRVIADACGDSADEEYAAGIFNLGVCYCVDTNVDGTLSGLQNNYKVYVQGGTFTGYSHGGFYLCHGELGEAFIKDATIRCNNYVGSHADLFPSSGTAVYGHMYVGGGADSRNSNITAYFDRCTFGDGVTGTYDMILRGSSGEQGHVINVSNCTFTVNKVRIDNNTMTLNMGKDNIINNFSAVGNNLTENRVFYTNEIYRKYGEKESINGNDLNTLIGLHNLKMNASEITCNIAINGEQKTSVTDALASLAETLEALSYADEEGF